MQAGCGQVRGAVGMIPSVIAVTLPGFMLGAIFMALANRRTTADIARARWLKLAVFFLIVHVVLAVSAAGRPWVTALVAVILAAGGVELSLAWRAMKPPRPARAWALFAVVAVLALVTSWYLPSPVFAFLFLVTAACDGFSQVTGQLVGRVKLAPRVSPRKTVEGLAGGLVAAVVVALLLRDMLGAGLPATVTIALLAGVAGLAGDLAASWVKRRAGIKDFSAALPGQGGFLDRFDSLLGALVFVGTLLAVAGMGLFGAA
jgi:phosphatidate cytidylyltransferase